MLTRADFMRIPTTDAELEDMILAHEGGIFTNHPLDRGGPTKFGITMKLLSTARGRICTAKDVEGLTRDEAAAIYRRFFIRPFDGLSHQALRANVIDMGVNAGIQRATLLLQQTVGADVDGRIGPQTRRLANMRDWNSLYVGVRLAFYEGIIDRDETQSVWRNGWRNRALSFFLTPRLRVSRPTLEPVFGFMGKAA